MPTLTYSALMMMVRMIVMMVMMLRMTTVMMIFLTLSPKRNDGDDTFSLGAFNGEHTADGSVRGMWWMQMCTVVKLVSLFLEQPSLF